VLVGGSALACATAAAYHRATVARDLLSGGGAGDLLPTSSAFETPEGSRVTTTTETAKETTQEAKQQAGEVAGATSSAAADVAGTAKEQAGQVVGEAVNQAQDLLAQTQQQITDQAGEQTQRLAANVRQLAQQLTSMAQSGEPGTTAHSLVQQLADRGHRAAGYLEGRQPGDLVTDLQSLGRRRPGAFLLGAALAGAAVGRLAAAKRAQSTEPPSTGMTSETTGPGGTTALYPNTMPVRENVTPGTPTVDPYPVTGYPHADGTP